MADDEPGSTEFTATNPPFFAFTTLNQGFREDLVLLSTVDAAAAFIQANTLELSALGANTDLSGSWNAADIDVTAWHDIGQGGRTAKSVIVQRGYLFPLGHQASITTVFRRVVAVDPSNAPSDPSNYPVAYLMEQTFIHVTEQVKSYPAVGQPFPQGSGPGTYDWPFTSVRMITVQTPPIDSAVGVPNQETWPTINGLDFQWNFVATDGEGQDVGFTMPLAFIYGADVGFGYQSEFGSYTNTPVSGYNTGPDHPTWSLTGGVPMQLAVPPAGSAAGYTTHPVLGIVLGAATSTSDANAYTPTFLASVTQTHLQAAGQPNFYPTIKSLRIRLHAADVLTGSQFNDDPIDDLPSDVGGVAFSYYPPYTQHGLPAPANSTRKTNSDSDLPANLGGVFAQALNPAQLGLPGSTVGGLGNPGTAIAGLSAEAGAIGGGIVSDVQGSLTNLENYAKSGLADVSQYFPTNLESAAEGAVSQLLGGLNLGDILSSTGFSMPNIVSQINPRTGTLNVTYTLSTRLQAWNSIFVPDDDDAMLNLTADVSIPPKLSGGSETYSVKGSIDPFMIYLIGDGDTDFINLHFESVTFTAGNGSKPKVNVNMDQVNFGSCLEFVQLLEQYLQSFGGGALAVDVEPTEVTLGTSLSLPEIDLGMLTLSGISFSAGIVIPFLGAPTVATFSFASKASPFTLTVAMFGGGGFFNIAVGFGGIQSVHAQFDFTGQFAFDIAVASGSLSLTAGVYFSYTPPKINLSGFITVTGQLMILGIINISALLSISLSYATGGVVSGTATLQAHISVCGFGKTVGVTMTKTFAGSSGGSSSAIRRANQKALGQSPPPVTWNNLVQPADWQTYCGAFATS